MLKAYGAGDLLDAHIGVRKEGGRTLHSMFREQATQAEARILFDQVSQVRLAQVACEGQLSNIERRMGFNHLQDSAKTAIPHHWNDRAQLCGKPRRYCIEQRGI